MALEFQKEKNGQDQVKVNRCISLISDVLRNNGYDASEKNIIVVAYLLYETMSEDGSSIVEPNFAFERIMEITSKQQMEIDYHQFIRPHLWRSLSMISYNFNKQILREVILKNFPASQKNAEGTTSSSVCKLTERILNIRKGDFVGDICCGQGAFMTHVLEKFEDVDFYGIELSSDNVMISRIRYSVLRNCEAFDEKYLNRYSEFSLNNRIPIHQGDVFLEFAEYKEDRPRFDKAFANYPWNLRLRNQFGFQRYVEYNMLYDDVRGKCSSDWFFNDILVKSLKPGGKAVGIMSLGSGWNKTDEKARKFFIDNRFVEAVIRLPERLFGHTSLAANLIVLGNSENGVRFIDASNEFVEGRRYNEFSDENIEYILKMLEIDNENSRFVSIEEIEMNDYVLSPERYLIPHEDIKNGVKLEEVLKAIKRSAPLTASKLDEVVTTENTHIKFVRQSDIQDGDVSEDLPSLKHFEKSWEKYLLKNNDLIILKTMQPLKTAIIHLEEDDKVLPVGNMYVLEPDETKINPYYLKAFFESENGRSILSKGNTGTNVQIISVDVLKNLVIPVPDMKVQDQIARRYRAALDEVRIAKLRLARALDKLNGAFEEGREEN